MKIIGFAGKGRVGKTTTALSLSSWITQNYSDVHVEIIPFALPLKEEVAKMAGYDSWYVYKKEHPEEYRYECQDRGSKARQENENYWVDAWVERVKSSQEAIQGKDIVIIVDDVRYPNELETIKSMGGEVTFICHNGRILEDHWALWRDHESEVMANEVEKNLGENYQSMLWFPMDWLIINDYITLEEFEESLDNLYPCLYEGE